MSVSRREILIGGALASAAIGSGIMRLRSSGTIPGMRKPLDEIVPLQIGPWIYSASGDRLIPTGERPEDEAYDDLLTRYYVSPDGHTVMALLAYGTAQSGSAQLHRPESCYPAAGFDLKDFGSARFEVANRSVHARTLTAQVPGRTEHILYWSRIGDRFPTNSAGQRWATFRQALDGAAPDGALVRLSMIHPDPAEALQLLTNFARALLANTNPDLRQLVAGLS